MSGIESDRGPVKDPENHYKFWIIWRFNCFRSAVDLWLTFIAKGPAVNFRSVSSSPLQLDVRFDPPWKSSCGPELRALSILFQRAFIEPTPVPGSVRFCQGYFSSILTQSGARGAQGPCRTRTWSRSGIQVSVRSYLLLPRFVSYLDQLEPDPADFLEADCFGPD